uniref:Uncharacterized protein LOC114335184 isoform X2 n=1 Tax=Diabrotica virgifera virgifera TaxID=50390 RepID=A0A6P7FX89_DIAVI
MPHKAYYNNYVVTLILTGVIMGAILIISGFVRWRTLIVAEALSSTKEWFKVLGIFMMSSNAVGFISVQSKSRGLRKSKQEWYPVLSNSPLPTLENLISKRKGEFIC